ncbi:hypothetical protein HOB94_02745 [bacterium]|nr:hypothetical protein [bacterium]
MLLKLSPSKYINQSSLEYLSRRLFVSNSTNISFHFNLFLKKFSTSIQNSSSFIFGCFVSGASIQISLRVSISFDLLNSIFKVSPSTTSSTLAYQENTSKRE